MGVDRHLPQTKQRRLARARREIRQSPAAQSDDLVRRVLPAEAVLAPLAAGDVTPRTKELYVGNLPIDRVLGGMVTPKAL